MSLGKFITLEGGEGLGKSTNLVFIKDLLIEQGIDVVVTREPGGTDLAELIRELLLKKTEESITQEAELLLMFAARAQHVNNFIKPALAKGQWVLCDRFTDSTYAYQGGGRHIATETISWLEQYVQKELEPDLTLLFDAPVELGLSRVKKLKVLDRIESEQLEFFSHVRMGYLKQAMLHPQRIKTIDASFPLVDVQENIRQLLLEFNA